MDRRSFLRGAAAAPALLPAVAAATMQQPEPAQPLDYSRRYSSNKADPGYANWCMANGDRKIVKVYLDDVEQKDCVMADEINGVVERLARTPDGNIAFGRDELLHETVRGTVRLEILPR